MYKASILLLLVFMAMLSNAQSKYRAIYMDSTANNFEQVRQDLIAGKISMATDSIMISRELLKSVQNHFIYSEVCTPEKIQSETITENSGDFREESGFVAKARNTGYAVFDKTKLLLSSISVKNGETTTKCRYIDTSDMHFKPTGVKKKINDWMCEEYVSIYPEYAGYVLWASTEIPQYVHTAYLMPLGVKGGIVQTEYRMTGNFVTLVSLTETSVPIEPIQFGKMEETRNFQDIYEGYINHPLYKKD